MEFKTFNDAEAAAEAFDCDGTCNNDSDVCAHPFAWPCPKCGRRIQVARDGMDAYQHAGGKCESCFVED